MSKVFYITLHLNARIPFGELGFTSCVFCNVQAEEAKEAEDIAKEHFETKGRAKVVKMFTRIQHNHCSNVLIKTGSLIRQSAIQK